MVIIENKKLENKNCRKKNESEKWWIQNCEHKKFLFIANVQPLRNALNKMILSRTDTEKWRGRVNKLYCYVTVIKKTIKFE